MNETNEEGEGSFQRTPPLAPSSAPYINYHSVSPRRSVKKIDEVPSQREQLLLGGGHDGGGCVDQHENFKGLRERSIFP